jgi:hypothetical protein
MILRRVEARLLLGLPILKKTAEGISGSEQRWFVLTDFLTKKNRENRIIEIPWRI